MTGMATFFGADKRPGLQVRARSGLGGGASWILAAAGAGGTTHVSGLLRGHKI